MEQFLNALELLIRDIAGEKEGGEDRERKVPELMEE
jgi:hypothetical protein